MEIDKLYDTYYAKAEKNESEKLLKWINNLLKKDKNDIDLRYLYLDILRRNNLDVEDDKAEPEVLELCTNIIKTRADHDPITIAKAYAYRGEMRHFGIDRRKDFDKAKNILINLNKKNGEVYFLNEFIKPLYGLEFRRYLPMSTNYLNMFKVD